MKEKNKEPIRNASAKIAVNIEDKFIDVGYETVTISKVFGPLIFNDIRITANAETCEWIIEREMHYEIGPEEAKKNVVDPKAETIWQEWCRIPGQMQFDGKIIYVDEDGQEIEK